MELCLTCLKECEAIPIKHKNGKEYHYCKEHLPKSRKCDRCKKIVQFGDLTFNNEALKYLCSKCDKVVFAKMRKQSESGENRKSA